MKILGLKKCSTIPVSKRGFPKMGMINSTNGYLVKCSLCTVHPEASLQSQPFQRGMIHEIEIMGNYGTWKTSGYL